MGYTILIVDDDREFRSEFRDILEEYYEVLEASHGEEALQIMKKPNIVDLVVLDIKMPGPQGTEVLKEIKKINPSVYIIMLTGYGSKETIIESLRGNADDFLEKPVRVETALKTIKKFLDKKQSDINGVIEKIKYFIEKNYNKNISLREASDIVYLSPKYISRLFKESTGMGFNEYKLHLRIDKAKQLLQTTDLHVNEISYKTGYLNVESFIRIFKKLTGTTPNNYRQKAKTKDKDG
jgi:two-component system response regulator YesN